MHWSHGLAVESPFIGQGVSQIDSQKRCMHGWAKYADCLVIHDSSSGLDSLDGRIVNSGDNNGEYSNKVKE